MKIKYLERVKFSFVSIMTCMSKHCRECIYMTKMFEIEAQIAKRNEMNFDIRVKYANCSRSNGNKVKQTNKYVC